MMVDVGEEKGTIQENEKEMINNILILTTDGYGYYDP